MNKFVEFLLLDVAPGIEYTISVPADMPVGEVAELLRPHTDKCIISDVSVTEKPNESRLEECIDIVFNTTNPGDDITEKDAERIINELKDDGWDIPKELTPALFIELFDDLEPEEEDE